MLIDDAWKVLEEAKDGNQVSVTVYNEWAQTQGMPTLPHTEYDKVKTYDDFYNLVFYFTMSD